MSEIIGVIIRCSCGKNTVVKDSSIQKCQDCVMKDYVYLNFQQAGNFAIPQLYTPFNNLMQTTGYNFLNGRVSNSVSTNINANSNVDTNINANSNVDTNANSNVNANMNITNNANVNNNMNTTNNANMNDNINTKPLFVVGKPKISTNSNLKNDINSNLKNDINSSSNVKSSTNSNAKAKTNTISNVNYDIKANTNSNIKANPNKNNSNIVNIESKVASDLVSSSSHSDNDTNDSSKSGKNGVTSRWGRMVYSKFERKISKMINEKYKNKFKIKEIVNPRVRGQRITATLTCLNCDDDHFFNIYDFLDYDLICHCENTNMQDGDEDTINKSKKQKSDSINSK
jgi:hypothetical protein